MTSSTCCSFYRDAVEKRATRCDSSVCSSLAHSSTASKQINTWIRQLDAVDIVATRSTLSSVCTDLNDIVASTQRTVTSPVRWWRRSRRWWRRSRRGQSVVTSSDVAAVRPSDIYTLSLKKGATFIVCNNFGKCRPILIILSLLYSQIYCWGGWY